MGRERWMTRRITAKAKPIVIRLVSSAFAKPLIAGARYPA